MKRKKKASELTKGLVPVFGKTVGFYSNFPMIEKIWIEIIEYRDAFWNEVGNGIPSSYNQDQTPPEYFDCHNSQCVGGGVSIYEVLRELTRSGETECDITKQCIGKENTHSSCYHHFRIKVKLGYKKP